MRAFFRDFLARALQRAAGALRSTALVLALGMLSGGPPGLLAAPSTVGPKPPQGPAPVATGMLPPLESMARRALPCTACHGAEGRAVGSAYVPRIAGKPAGYLYRQMLNFRDGQRRHDGMARLLTPLSDAYLRELAEHFATLDLPWPAPAGGAGGAVAPATLARGEQLVRQGDAGRRLPACVACHGQALTGVAPAIPGLLGLPQDYITAQLGAWRAGTRRALAPDCMQGVARALSAEDSAALAAWLARQPVPAPHRAAAALPAPLPLRCGAVSAEGGS